MSRNFLMSAVVLVPVMAVGGIAGSRLHPQPPAASSIDVGSMNVLEMHHANLPQQKLHDMTFVFSDEN